MVDKVFGLDFSNETAPTGTSTVSVYNGSALVDVELQNLHKALTQATDSQAGTVELATNAEALLGTDTARAITAAALAYLGIKDGWIPDTNTWSYSSADSPTFVISVNADMTGLIGVGNRIKLTQTSAKYFIVTAVGTFSAGATLITVYGGTDYTLANAAITSPYFSKYRFPQGFPTDPDKWIVSLSDTSNRSQASPVANTWYNPGSLSISIPIGSWRVKYEAVGEVIKTVAAAEIIGYKLTLSTANNSESDGGFTGRKTSAMPVMTGATDRFSIHREKFLTLAAKTSYFLNITTGASSTTSISIRGDDAPTVIKAVCAFY